MTPSRSGFPALVMMAFAALTLTGACASRAQAVASQPDENAAFRDSAFMACVRAISRDSMERTTWYVEAVPPDGADSAIALQTDLIAQDVAPYMQALLRRPVPKAAKQSSGVGIFQHPEIIVVARPDGSMHWRGATSLGDSTFSLMLGAALDSARKHDAALLVWPDGYVADSIDMRLTLMSVQTPGAIRLRAPAHSFAVSESYFPISSPAQRITDQPPPQQPVMPRGQRASEGEVLMQFVVDTTGHSIPASIKDIRPRDQAALEGNAENYYRKYVQSLRQWIIGARFTPARVGTCPVKQIVKLPVHVVLYQ